MPHLAVIPPGTQPGPHLTEVRVELWVGATVTSVRRKPVLPLAWSALGRRASVCRVLASRLLRARRAREPLAVIVAMGSALYCQQAQVLAGVAHKVEQDLEDPVGIGEHGRHVLSGLHRLRSVGIVWRHDRETVEDRRELDRAAVRTKLASSG